MVGLVRFGLTREAGYLRLTGGHLLRGARETMLHQVGVLGSGIVASHGILSRIIHISKKIMIVSRNSFITIKH